MTTALVRTVVSLDDLCPNSESVIERDGKGRETKFTYTGPNTIVTVEFDWDADETEVDAGPTTTIIDRGFVVESVSGLALWLDATAIEDLADGEGIVAWLDKSGNANHLVQPTLSLQPTLAENAANNRNTVRFDGTQWIGSLDAFLSGTEGAVFIVASITDVTAGQAIFSSTDRHTNARDLLLVGVSSNDLIIQQEDDNDGIDNLRSTGTELSGLSGTPILLGYSGDGTSYGMRLNKTALSIEVVGGGADSGDWFGVDVDGDLDNVTVGTFRNNGVESSFMAGDICEIIVIDGETPSAQTIADIEEYLNVRWGLGL